ncbi:hypothetical protein SCLARK_00612 [Spiroplasma clarkii]|nr:hypothetical protein [Spiroplasma clarkii]ARU91281.1 hypothetical protein SCLARK_00612 [Spiroplasma clarkii]
MAKFFPELEEFKVISVPESYSLILNPGYNDVLKNYEINPNQLRGNQLVFQLQNQVFSYTIEYIKERVEIRRNDKGEETSRVYYHTFADVLIQQAALPRNENIYFICAHKVLLTPKPLAKFESESVAFNKKYKVFYSGDGMSVFNIFNPLVLDSFNNLEKGTFQNMLINKTDLQTYSVNEVEERRDHSVNAIYGPVLADTSLLKSLNSNVNRFEHTLTTIIKKLNGFKAITSGN